MYYFVQYNRKTGDIIGYFQSSTNELMPKSSSPDEGHIEVTEAEQVKLLHSFNPLATRLRGTVDYGKIRTLKLEPIFHGRIELSSDLSDRDGDGLPELPADGKAVARIRATLRGAGDKVLTGDVTTIRFQVNRGLLSQRQMKTEKGVAEVELRSVPETVRIRVVATAEGFEKATLDLETIPPEEHRALAAS